MSKLGEYFHRMFYSDLPIDAVEQHLGKPEVMDRAVSYVQKIHYPDIQTDIIKQKIMGYDPTKNIMPPDEYAALKNPFKYGEEQQVFPEYTNIDNEIPRMKEELKTSYENEIGRPLNNTELAYFAKNGENVAKFLKECTTNYNKVANPSPGKSGGRTSRYLYDTEFGNTKEEDITTINMQKTLEHQKWMQDMYKQQIERVSEFFNK